MEPSFTTVYAKDLSDHYLYIKRLGQGTFGKVLHVQEKATGNPVAMKLVRKDRTNLRAFLKELSMSISLCNNPCIITTYPLFIETMKYYILTQELATAGTLQHLIESEVGIPEVMVKRCGTQLARALDFMQSRRLVHRDLRADNVLLMDMECHDIKLCDFGLSQAIGSLVSKMSHTTPYLTPELCALKDDEYLVLTARVDSWALAVLLYVALTGNYPWESAVEEDIMYQAFNSWQKSSKVISPPAHWKMFTQEALNMFKKLLSQDPDSQASVLSITNCVRYTWTTVEFSEGEMTEEEDTEWEMTEEEDTEGEMTEEEDTEGEMTEEEDAEGEMTEEEDAEGEMTEEEHTEGEMTEEEHTEGEMTEEEHAEGEMTEEEDTEGEMTEEEDAEGEMIEEEHTEGK